MAESAGDHATSTFKRSYVSSWVPFVNDDTILPAIFC